MILYSLADLYCYKRIISIIFCPSDGGSPTQCRYSSTRQQDIITNIIQDMNSFKIDFVVMYGLLGNKFTSTVK
jgi:hypothetical protein